MCVLDEHELRHTTLLKHGALKVGLSGELLSNKQLTQCAQLGHDLSHSRRVCPPKRMVVALVPRPAFNNGGISADHPPHTHTDIPPLLAVSPHVSARRRRVSVLPKLGVESAFIAHRPQPNVCILGMLRMLRLLISARETLLADCLGKLK